MKKHHIILLILLILACVLTMPFIPKARAGSTDTQKTERLIAPKAKKAAQEKEERRYCGHLRRIRITGFTANPPFSWLEKDEKGKFELKGYAVDVFRQIAKKHGWKFESMGYTSQADIITALNRGQVDIVVASYLVQSDSIDATPIYPGYFKNIFIVYSLADKKERLKSMEDLIGLRGVVRQEENIYGLLMNKQSVAKLDLQQVKTAETAFRMLLTDDTDYLVGSPYSVEAELRRLKLVGKIVPVRIALMEGSLFFVMSNASRCYYDLKPILEQDLKEYVQQGTALDEIHRTLNNWGESFRYDRGLTIDDETITDQQQ